MYILNMWSLYETSSLDYFHFHVSCFYTHIFGHVFQRKFVLRETMLQYIMHVMAAICLQKKIKT